MKAKLIKTDVNYLLNDEEDVVIASTSFKTLGISLSKQNCDEIFGIVDIEKIAKDDADLRFPNKGEEDSWLARNSGVVWGYNKAKETYKYTEEDIQKAIQFGLDGMYGYESGEDGTTKNQIKRFIQSIQQPTEIEVEILMKRVVDETKVIGVVKGVKGSGDKITTYKSVPKLDPDGCLILKKI